MSKYASYSVPARNPRLRMSSTTPTISALWSLDKLMRLPRGLTPGKYRLAMDSLTIATSGVSGLSRMLKSRPKSKRVPKVLKKPGETKFRNAVVLSLGDSGCPSTVKGWVQQKPAMGVFEDKLADWIAGCRFRFSNNSAYSRISLSPV